MWGYYLAGTWLILVATVIVATHLDDRARHRRTQAAAEPAPVHPDDWHPTAPLWDETEQEQQT